MKKNILSVIILLGGSIFLTACPDDFEPEKAGQKASKEFCECIKEKSESTCIDQMNADYRKYIAADEFYESANDTNECGYTFYKKVVQK